jgi:hypothetical protein
MMLTIGTNTQASAQQEASGGTTTGATISPSVDTTSSSSFPTRSLNRVQPSSASIPSSIEENWNDILQADLSPKLYNRLLKLAASAADSPLRTKSIRDFLDFWSLIKVDAKEPELAMDPNGALHAEWFKTDQERLDIRFARHEAVFGLFAKRSIFEGTEIDFQRLADILRSHSAKPLLWTIP